MNSTIIDWDAIDGAFCDICEKTGFLILDPIPAGQVRRVDVPLIQAWVDFTGVLTGRVLIATTMAAARAMAANMLAEADLDAVAPERAGDILGELANIAAGVVAGMLTEEQGRCEFTPPVAQPLEHHRWQELLRDAWVRAFTADEGSLLLRCQIEGHPRN